MTKIDQEPRGSQPEVMVLCREDDGGEEQLAGWVMVLPVAAVAYVSDSNGRGALLSSFSSLAAAERLLGYGGLYLRETAANACAADHVSDGAAKAVSTERTTYT
jgi:hypothetical protein